MTKFISYVPNAKMMLIHILHSKHFKSGDGLNYRM